LLPYKVLSALHHLLVHKLKKGSEFLCPVFNGYRCVFVRLNGTASDNQVAFLDILQELAGAQDNTGKRVLC
jgi:hypothetical protein